MYCQPPVTLFSGHICAIMPVLLQLFIKNRDVLNVHCNLFMIWHPIIICEMRVVVVTVGSSGGGLMGGGGGVLSKTLWQM